LNCALRLSGGGTNPLTEAKSVAALWRLLGSQCIELVQKRTD